MRGACLDFAVSVPQGTCSIVWWNDYGDKDNEDDEDDDDNNNNNNKKSSTSSSNLWYFFNRLMFLVFRVIDCGCDTLGDQVHG